MEGIVKWFSNEKGFGFITPISRKNNGYTTVVTPLIGKDHYFNVRDLEGTYLPKNGDEVRFQSKESKKGFRAFGISVTKKNISNSFQNQKRNAVKKHKDRADDRIDCPKCNKRIVPRMIFKDGNPSRTVCPFCATQITSFGLCFLTTACTSHAGLSDNCFQLQTLRTFRDTYIHSLINGKELIDEYYQYAPFIVIEIINNNNRDNVLKDIFYTINKCVSLILNEEYEDAFFLYKNMFKELKDQFLTK